MRTAAHNSDLLSTQVSSHPPPPPRRQANTDRCLQPAPGRTLGVARGCHSLPSSRCFHAKEKRGRIRQLETRYCLSLPRAAKHPQLGLGKTARLRRRQLVTKGERDLRRSPNPPHSTRFLLKLKSLEEGHGLSTCATLLLRTRRLAPAMN